MSNIDTEGTLRYRLRHVPENTEGARLGAQIDGVVIEDGEPVLLLRVTVAEER